MQEILQTHSSNFSQLITMPSLSTEHIPASARDAINHYEHLRVSEGKTVRCPYYRNPRNGTHRWGLNAFSGKGSAREIEEELKIIQKLEGKDFSALSEEGIRDIMKKRKLGVECSGFVSHVLDAWIWEAKRKHIFQALRFPARGILGMLASALRPFTHIDVATLIAPRNAKEFFSLQEFRPGDFIYFHNEIDHIVLVTGIARFPTEQADHDKNFIQQIFYAHSVREDSGEGIKEGVVTVRDGQKSILEQDWQEVPETGRAIGKRDHQAVVRFFHPLFLPE